MKYNNQDILSVYSLDYDVKLLERELEELFPRINFDFMERNPTPDGSYYYNVKGNMPSHIVHAIERSIGQQIEDYFFIWEWVGDELTKHIDKRTNQFGEVPPTTAVVALEADFKLDIWEHDQHTLKDTYTYNPGDIIVLNNTGWYHSGHVVNKKPGVRKRSLNCYIKN